jgi:hypothetical protein
LSVARLVCVLLLMAGLAPVAHAEDTPVTKPASAATTPAQTPAKSAPAASKTAASTAKTAKKAPPAEPAEPEADDELLEFLGSVDTLEQGSKDQKNE